MGNIILVDDDGSVRNCVSRVLKNAGHVVTPFGKPLDALAAFARGDGGDVLLSDFHLPDCTGLELIERVRSLGLADPPECMILTAAIVPMLPPSVVHVNKPFSIHTLKATVARVLALREARRAAMASLA